MAQDEGDGKGPNFHSAAEDAWENAKAKGNDKGLFEVKSIVVKTDNPITEYRVKIKRTGNA